MPGLVQEDRDGDGNGFRETVAACSDGDILEAVDDEHGEDGAGQGAAEILDVIGRGLPGRKDQEGKVTREHRADGTGSDGDDLFSQCHSLDPLPFKWPTYKGKYGEDDDHRGNDEGLAAKKIQAEDGGGESDPGGDMGMFAFVLLEEDDDEHRRHDEGDALRIERQQGAHEASDGRAADPVEFVEQCDEEHEPAAVDAVRHFCGKINGKRFIAHAVNQIIFFPARILETVKHGNAVEEVARLDEDGHEKGLQRGKG